MAASDSTRKKPAVFFPIPAKKGFLRNCMRKRSAMKKGKPNRYIEGHAEKKVRAEIKGTTYHVKTVGTRATCSILQKQGFLPRPEGEVLSQMRLQSQTMGLL
eukprot:3386673-Amphidinium_carterae.1